MTLERAMLVWINGAFGAGKSSVTEQLTRIVERIIVFDPEEAGFHLRAWVPMPDSGDFQDLACWREVVARSCAAFVRHYPDHLLVVPMTVVNDAYRREIFDIVREEGDGLLHVWLSADRALLTRRITAQVIHPDDPVRNADVRTWRLGRIDAALACEDRLGADTLVLPTGTASPRQLAERIATRAGVTG
ncbi:tunicamycin resistance protein [Streptomyces sp. NPDC002225]|uniref:tunicamycin resistance protein n=1 Tax=Streptomyces sp. NPDC002225 TaxID=3154413 RepID=UPI00331A2C6D